MYTCIGICVVFTYMWYCLYLDLRICGISNIRIVLFMYIMYKNFYIYRDLFVNVYVFLDIFVCILKFICGYLYTFLRIYI